MNAQKDGCFLNLSVGDVDVSKNGGTPKWMVYNGKPYLNG